MKTTARTMIIAIIPLIAVAVLATSSTIAQRIKQHSPVAGSQATEALPGSCDSLLKTLNEISWR